MLFFFSLFFISLKIYLLNEVTDISLTLAHYQQEAKNQVASLDKIYSLKISQPSGNFIKILPNRKNKSIPLHIFASLSKNNLDFSAEYKQIEDNSFLYIPSNYSKDGLLYLKILCEDTCEFNLIYKYVDDYEIVIGHSFDIPTNKGKSIENIKYNVDSAQEEPILFSFLGSSVVDFNVIGKMGKKEIQLQKYFINGYGIIIYKNKLSEITFSLLTKQNDVITISATTLQDNIEELYENMIVLSLLGPSSRVLSKCYLINEKGNYIVNARVYAGKAEFYMVRNTKEGENKYISTSDYFRFEISIPSLEMLCIRSQDDVGIQFQLVNEEKIQTSQSKSMFQIRGLITKAYIPKNTILYYRMNTYGTSSGYEFSYALHRIKGKALLYQGSVSDFPNSQVTQKEINELESDQMFRHTSHNINDHFYLVETMESDYSHQDDVYHSPYQWVAIVQCPDNEDCVYEISIKNDYDPMYLTSKARVGALIKERKKHLYRVFLNDSKVKQICIVLYSFSGNVDLKVYLDPEEKNSAETYYQAGNKEYYVIKGDQLKNKLFYITVNPHTNSYYNIHYFTSEDEDDIKEFELPSGEMVLETISKKEDKKTYILENRGADKYRDYMIFINSVNCITAITFRNNTQFAKSSQIFIPSDHPEHNSEKYQLEVRLLSLDSGSESENENCMFYIGGIEISKGSKIVLNEGVIHKVTLTEKEPKMTFLYPYFLASSFDSMILYFSKEREGVVELKYALDNEKYTSLSIKSQRKTIYLDNWELVSVCQASICPLTIEVSLGEKYPKGGISIDIQVVGSHSVPTYLPMGVIRLDGIKTKQYQYYYSDVRKNQSGEVIINFKSGSGSAVAKIVPKTKKEEHPDWNQRIKLPKENDTNDLLSFDFYNKKFVFSEEDTSGCDNGCEIFVGVYTLDETTTKSIKEYTIFIREEETVTYLPLNEYVFGSLSKTEKEEEFDFFTTTIQSETQEIIIYFNSELCTLYINCNPTTPTPLRHQFKLDADKSILKITGENLYGRIFSFAVGTKSLDGEYSSYYSFKIISKDKDLPIINEVISSQSEHCNIDEVDPFCYFIIPIYSYNYVDTVYLYAMNEQSYYSDFSIYITIKSIALYDKLSPAEIKEILPTEEKYDFTSKDQFNTNYFKIHYKETGPRKEDYIIVMIKPNSSIQSSFKTRITLLTSFYKSPYKTFLRPNSNEIFYLEGKKKMRLDVFGEGVYFLEVIATEGKGVFKIGNTTRGIELDVKKKSTIAMVISPEKTNFVEITVEVQELLAFYIKFSVRTNKGNFDQISYGRINRIEYSFGNDYFPISFYLPIYDVNQDHMINVKINSETFENLHSEKSSDEFTLQGVVTDERFILDRKKNLEAAPEAGAMGSLNYDPSLNKGNFFFKSKDIQEYSTAYRKFFYISLTPSERNNNTYKKISLDVHAFPSSSQDLTIPINEYYYSKISGDKKMLKLIKPSENDTIMEIEISTSRPRSLRFAINKYSQPSFTKNDTSLIISSFLSSDKNILTVNTKGIRAIAFGIEPQTNSSIDYAMRFRSSEKPFNHFTIQNSKIISYKKDKSLFMRVSSIKNSDGENARDVLYTIKVYPRYFFEEGEVNSIFVSKTPIKVYRKEVREFIDDEAQVELFDFPLGENYVCTTATLKSEEDYEILGYEAFEVFKGEGESRLFFWVILLVGVTVMIIFVIFVMYRKVRKLTDKITKETIEYSSIGRE